jgi:hypothetical protein
MQYDSIFSSHFERATISMAADSQYALRTYLQQPQCDSPFTGISLDNTAHGRKDINTNKRRQAKIIEKLRILELQLEADVAGK